MSIYDGLNDKQKEAVEHTEGPLLILAGAGSGKTGVLTHRVAYLIDEKHVDPYNIMAITFTNKAAEEMRQRVDSLVGHGAEQVWVATFHSSCVRILRRYIDRIGYDNSFSIYDGDDQKSLMKKIFKELNIDTKQFKERNVLRIISTCKDEMMGPDEYEKEAVDYYEKKVVSIYRAYQSTLKKNNALDFDDLIVLTVKLLREHEDVRSNYQMRFRYIMVDEYQDTNTAQFKLVELLAGGYKNLCVVGDDDQSIYKFRGANIENILSFEDAYPGAKVIKLEQNYRSTANILDAANGVIHRNRGRKDKTLWTAEDSGDKIGFYQYDTAYDEADAVIRDIKAKASGSDYNNFAVLYRTNAQSRILEERCVSMGVPYQLVGGVNFYQRKEIKDVLAYLKTISNGRDDLAVGRIINVPKRGIGNASVEKLASYAAEQGISLYDACRISLTISELNKASAKISKFAEMIEDYRDRLRMGFKISDLIKSILEDTGYKKELEDEGEIESQARLENIDELINKAISYEEEYMADEGEPTDSSAILSSFLEEVALVADIDRLDDSEARVTLMTLHAAKGLEFEYVYMTGMEDGLFPSNMSIAADDKSEIEEERRLCYVGITRAKKHLTLTCARSRMVNGETRWTKPSRFTDEIPDSLLDKHMLDSASKYEKDAKEYDSFTKRRQESGLKSVSTITKPTKAPSWGKAFVVDKADHLDYAEGDRVTHAKFGEGTVKSIVDGSKDYEVTVDFDEAGTKKMFAGFAKLKKL